ncbi:hypothetical protein SAMN05444743_1521, partial [Pseudomonas sp. PDC86]
MLWLVYSVKNVGGGLPPMRVLKCAPEVGHPSNFWGVFMSKYTTQFKLSAITA